MLCKVVTRRPMVPRQAGGLSPIVAVLAMIGVMLAAGAQAAAQTVRPIEPKWVVVTAPDLPLKAGPASVHYAVVMLKAGQVLRADGETTDDPVFLRVEYPRGVSAFVKAEEVTVEGDGDRVRLNAPSRLRAANLSGGERGHWWYLLPEESPLPAGTELLVTEALETTDNRVYGYKVVAPPAARGFVRADAVRAASQEEVERHLESLAGTPAAAAPEVPAAEPAAAQPEPAVDEAPVSPQPQPEPAAAPVEEPAAAPAVEQPQQRAPQPAVQQRPAAGVVATLESLESLFNQVQAQPIREAELSEVIAEFERAIGALGESPEENATRQFLGSRLQLLRLRADLQRAVREADELAGRVAERDARLAAQISEIHRSRSYAVVGRIMPSTVYDGRRLPKMYRVQSVDEGFSRTLAYLLPGPEEMDLDAMVGRVVGIVGETRHDPALKVNIVQPRRVDVLTPVPAAPGEGT